MKTVIEIENIKCGGCANSIRKELGSLQGVFGAEVDFIHGNVSIEHTDEVDRKTICNKLLQMGYPEKGTVEGISALKSQAKSYVSCAIGKFIK